VLIGGTAIVVKDVGQYFIDDATKEIRITKFGSEFGRVKKIVQFVKSAGLIIFIISISAYIYLSIKSPYSK